MFAIELITTMAHPGQMQMAKGCLHREQEWWKDAHDMSRSENSEK